MTRHSRFHGTVECFRRRREKRKGSFLWTSLERLPGTSGPVFLLTRKVEAVTSSPVEHTLPVSRLVYPRTRLGFPSTLPDSRGVLRCRRGRGLGKIFLSPEVSIKSL